jgi:hypothetical protein
MPNIGNNIIYEMAKEGWWVAQLSEAEFSKLKNLQNNRYMSRIRVDIRRIKYIGKVASSF